VRRTPIDGNGNLFIITDKTKVRRGGEGVGVVKDETDEVIISRKMCVYLQHRLKNGLEEVKKMVVYYESRK
jgi:hypothetical protein